MSDSIALMIGTVITPIRPERVTVVDVPQERDTQLAVNPAILSQEFQKMEIKAENKEEVSLLALSATPLPPADQQPAPPSAVEPLHNSKKIDETNSAQVDSSLATTITRLRSRPWHNLRGREISDLRPNVPGDDAPREIAVNASTLPGDFPAQKDPQMSVGEGAGHGERTVRDAGEGVSVRSPQGLSPVRQRTVIRNTGTYTSWFTHAGNGYLERPPLLHDSVQLEIGDLFLLTYRSQSRNEDVMQVWVLLKDGRDAFYWKEAEVGHTHHPILSERILSFQQRQITIPTWVVANTLRRHHRFPAIVSSAKPSS